MQARLRNLDQSPPDRLRLLIATRFATHDDVFWIGMKHPRGGANSFAAGHLQPGTFVDRYTPATTIPVTGAVDAATNTIRMSVPVSALTTSLLVPQGAPAQTVQAWQPGNPLWSVAGVAFVGKQTSNDQTAKNLLDATPDGTKILDALFPKEPGAVRAARVVAPTGHQGGHQIRHGTSRLEDWLRTSRRHRTVAQCDYGPYSRISSRNCKNIKPRLL